MRRDAEQWIEIAAEKIDGPDIEDRLALLVQRVEPWGAVALFLPRDQILYDDVSFSAPASRDAIGAALEGRTPYALDELQFDYELTSATTARVAAIARDTLDEARDFADARGLLPGAYSSLATATDFPRCPDFGGMGDFLASFEATAEPENIFQDDAAPVAFSTTRTDTASEVASADFDHAEPPKPADEPVVNVAEATPCKGGSQK